jgi:hypothetical protein
MMSWGKKSNQEGEGKRLWNVAAVPIFQLILPEFLSSGRTIFVVAFLLETHNYRVIKNTEKVGQT